MEEDQRRTTAHQGIEATILPKMRMRPPSVASATSCSFTDGINPYSSADPAARVDDFVVSTDSSGKRRHYRRDDHSLADRDESTRCRRPGGAFARFLFLPGSTEAIGLALQMGIELPARRSGQVASTVGLDCTRETRRLVKRRKKKKDRQAVSTNETPAIT